MFRKAVTPLSILSVILFINCKIVKQTAFSNEIIDHVSTFWSVKNGTTEAGIVVSERAYFDGSAGITQICSINSASIGNITKTEVVTIGYRFVDSKNMWAYEYGNFSDTARIMKKYAYTDTTTFVGGWNFTKHTSLPVDNYLPLPDTLINHKIYKQCRVDYIFNGIKFESTARFDCSRKNTYFTIDAKMSSEKGCPIVFMSFNPVNNPKAGLSREIRMVASQFPDSVARVFKAWKSNESKFPIH